MDILLNWQNSPLDLLLVAESATGTTEGEPILALTYIAVIIFSAIHYWGLTLYGYLYKSEKIAISFGGGMAIAYVFIHLMGELSAGYELFGSSIHLVTLLGFSLFYGMNRFIARVDVASDTKKNYISYLEIVFYCLYNFLIVYAIPDHFHNSFLLTFLYIIAMGFHFLHNDYSLAKKHKQQFLSFGRYAIIFSLILGLLAKVLIQYPSEFMTDILIAILAGIIISNVFTEELPKPENVSFRWFITGIITYLCLLIGVWLT